MEFQTFDDLEVGDVSRDVARELIIARHYSHKWNSAFGTNNVGVYRGGQLLGVAVYGFAMNPKSWGSITRLESKQCIELNRLWIDDALGKNTETWLMAQSFDILRSRGYRLVQSFADGRLGVGTMYQAANFTYHGHHRTVFHRDVTTGTTYHDTPFTDTSSLGMVFRNVLHAKQKTESFACKTYRYLKPLDRGARRTLTIDAQPYPKDRDGLVELTDYTPPPGQIARAYYLAEYSNNTSAAKTLLSYLYRLTDEPEKYLEDQKDNPWVGKVRERQLELPPPLFDMEPV